MLTVITLLKVHPSPNGEKHGERPFWRDWGTRYLNAWLSSVITDVPQPRRIVVMTDEPELVSYYWEGDWRVRAVLLDSAADAPGFWAKLNMFRPEVSTGKCLYLDLDNAINGPLDELCALEPDPLIMLDDRRVPGLPNGSAILFDAERCREIWARYTADKQFIEGHFVARGENFTHAYDQAFIADCIIDDIGGDLHLFQDHLPDGYILNALSELPNAPNWQSARLIFGCGIGEGKPHTSTHPGFSLR